MMKMKNTLKSFELKDFILLLYALVLLLFIAAAIYIIHTFPLEVFSIITITVLLFVAFETKYMMSLK